MGKNDVVRIGIDVLFLQLSLEMFMDDYTIGNIFEIVQGP
jgi:hypothetical protein